MIPKRAFFYWGGGPLPWIRRMGILSFVRHNPDWTVELFLEGSFWRPYDDLQEAGVLLSPVLEKDSDQVVKRSDLFRYLELAENGGAYFDTDIIFTRPINSLMERIGNADTVVCFEVSDRPLMLVSPGGSMRRSDGEDSFYSVASLMCAPDNVFYHEAHVAGMKMSGIDNPQSTGVFCLLGRFESLEKAKKEFPDLTFASIPRKAFLPLPYSSARSFYRDDFDLYLKLSQDEEVYGVHWFGGDEAARLADGWDESTYWKDCTLGLFLGDHIRVEA